MINNLLLFKLAIFSTTVEAIIIFLSHNSLFCQIPSFLRGTGLSPYRPLWNVSILLPQSQPSFALLPMQDKTEGEFFLQRLRTSSAGSYLLLDCPVSEPLRPPSLALLPFLTYGSDREAWPDCCGSSWSSLAPPSLKRGRVIIIITL